MPIGASTLTLAANYYDLAAGKGRSPFYNNSATESEITVGLNALSSEDALGVAAHRVLKDVLGAVKVPNVNDTSVTLVLPGKTAAVFTP